MRKINCEGKLFVWDFFGKFAKTELADNIARRCPRYKMNKIKCIFDAERVVTRSFRFNISTQNVPFNSNNGLPDEIKMSVRYSTHLTLQGFEGKLLHPAPLSPIKILESEKSVVQPELLRHSDQ